MIVKNSRKKLGFSNNNKAKFLILFEEVEYEKNNKKFREFQIEIELKFEFIHRINLKKLSDYLESEIQ